MVFWCVYFAVFVAINSMHGVNQSPPEEMKDHKHCRTNQTNSISCFHVVIWIKSLALETKYAAPTLLLLPASVAVCSIISHNILLVLLYHGAFNISDGAYRCWIFYPVMDGYKCDWFPIERNLNRIIHVSNSASRGLWHAIMTIRNRKHIDCIP